MDYKRKQAEGEMSDWLGSNRGGDQPKRSKAPRSVPWRGIDLCRINPFFCGTVPDVKPEPAPTPTPTPRGRK